MPRVIAGTARGIMLKQPAGRGTRPTSGRLREALFSMLEAAGVDFSQTLDLYAGTGALGIEALSRGEGHCTFVEKDSQAATVLLENLDRARLRERATPITATVGRWRPSAGAAFTLVTADPPYDDQQAWDAIAATLSGALAPGALVAVEHSARVAAPDRLGALLLWRDRRQGDGSVAIYRSADEETA